jgi:hypothetical protein
MPQIELRSMSSLQAQQNGAGRVGHVEEVSPALQVMKVVKDVEFTVM